MAIILEAVAANGTVQHVPLDATTTTIEAQPGLRYRLFNDAGGRVAPSALVKRVDGSLLVEGLPESKVLALEGFFTRCTPQDACSLSMDNIGGTAEEAVTPATAPVAALPEGGFLMYASGMTASSAAAPRESEFSFKPVLGVLGGLAIAGGAGGGGGGGSRGGGGATPTAPVLTNGAYVNDPEPVFTGTALAGTAITMTLDVGNDGVGPEVTYRTTAAADGSWAIDTGSLAPATGTLPPIAEGQSIGYRIQASNSAGVGSPVTTGTVTLDMTPPPPAAITSALLTNDTTPVIGGTSEEPGSIVRVELDLDGDGTIDATYTATVTSAGTWSVNLADAPASGALPGSKLGDVSTTGLTVTALDLAGNSAPALTAQLLVDTTRPDAPTIAPVTGDSAINATEAVGTVTITGTLPTGQQDRPVTVTWGDTTLAATVTGPAWSVTFSAAQIPADGNVTVIASYTNVFGTLSVQGTQDVLIDRVAPTPPTITVPENGGGGISAAEAGNGTQVVVNLTDTHAQVGETVSVAWGSQPAISVTLTTSHIGNSSVTIDVPAATLAAQGDGTFNVTASIDDGANPVATSSAVSVRVDTSAPSAPTSLVVPDFSDDGVIDAAEATGGTPVVVNLTGTNARAGDIVSVTWGSQPAVSVALTSGHISSNSVTVNVPQATLTAQGDGTFQVRASVNDGVNPIATSDPVSVSTNIGAPSPPTIAVPENAGGGISAAEAVNGTTVEVNLSGTNAAVGDTVSVVWGSQSVTPVTLDASHISSNSVTVNVPAATLAAEGDGTFDVTASIDDGVNPVATSTAVSVRVDTTAPGAPTIAVPENAGGGINAVEAANGTDVVVTLTGTNAQVGDTVSVVWGSQSVTPVTLDASHISSNSITVNVPAATLAAEGDGTFNVTASISDGVNPSAVSEHVEVSVDRVPPTIENIELVIDEDNIAPSAVEPSFGQTTDSTPTLRLTLEDVLGPGMTLELHRGTILPVRVGFAESSGLDEHQFTDIELSPGTYTYSASMTDAAGNVGTETYLVTIL